jgi:hypothetical protein
MTFSEEKKARFGGGNQKFTGFMPKKTKTRLEQICFLVIGIKRAKVLRTENF